MKARCPNRRSVLERIMPVRIYDISKKLGLENKEVLAKAKALGIAAAKVPSSSLDKITAEYLEEQILKDHPERRRAPSRPPPNRPSRRPSKNRFIIVSAPPAAAAAARRRSRRADRAGRRAPLGEAPPPSRIHQRRTAPNRPPRRSAVPPAPVEPPKPQGRRKGWLHSTAPTPAAPTGRRGGNVKPAARPVEPGRTDFLRRGDNRPMRGGGQPAPRSADFPASNDRPRGQSPAEPAKPAAPKFVLPDRRAGHHHQAAHRRPRTGRAAQAEAVQDHRRPDGAGRLRQRQPGDRRENRPADLRQVRLQV